MASCFRPRKARYEWSDYPSVRLSPSPTKHSRVTAAIKSQSQVLGFIKKASGRPQVYVRKTVSINSDILKGRDVPREYETWSSLGHHPHILACEDFQCSVNKYALDEATFWSEYCEMGDLGQYVCFDVTRKRTLSACQAEQIIHQMTSALVFIHYGIRITVDKQGCIEDVEMSEHPTLIHRDIKPQNSKSKILPSLYLV
jgi:serine/threonine protein kinase